ncbi:TlpA disulfide reductase family protein [Edaphobacter sp. 12200R-103]|uniref:TlpA family protein disulfide reductase n=1 Tax=Edaphobacter sp. 12200R-103 TaxID=2703788 RepID=UPI00138CB8BD|nr:TlpA disulfide reductase family protein [Edaphobacter sp. 12200R-103]QHS51645.1 TlpA family protein disulfide reductase [Edaphobacter sp. 12200R-103]
MKSILAAAIALLVVSLVIFVRLGLDTHSRLIPVAERKPMPVVHLSLLTGETWSLRVHRGEVIAINYWATWCGPCWQETPMLVQLGHDYGKRGFAIVGVATDERNSAEIPPAVLRFVERLHVDYPIAITAPMSQLAYAMDGLPTTILVDREGRVAQTYVGALNETKFRGDVDALLREPAQPSR